MTRRYARLGDIGEEAAADFLRAKGYKVIVANFRCPLGEIDLIAQDGRTLVVCEVKTRTDDGAGHPLESITPRKRAKLRQVAAYYWEYEADQSLAFRFDFIAVFLKDDVTRIEHLIDALHEN